MDNSFFSILGFAFIPVITAMLGRKSFSIGEKWAQ
jgi:hypothetical protein